MSKNVYDRERQLFTFTIGTAQGLRYPAVGNGNVTGVKANGTCPVGTKVRIKRFGFRVLSGVTTTLVFTDGDGVDYPGLSFRVPLNSGPGTQPSFVELNIPVDNGLGVRVTASSTQSGYVEYERE